MAAMTPMRKRISIAIVLIGGLYFLMLKLTAGKGGAKDAAA